MAFIYTIDFRRINDTMTSLINISAKGDFIMKMVTLIALIGTALVACGCGYYYTKFEPRECLGNDGGNCFNFVVQSGIESPLNDPKAEEERIKWLERRLKENGYSVSEYEIISRQPVLIRKSPFGFGDGLYDVHYLVKARNDRDNPN